MIKEQYTKIKNELPTSVALVAVSKRQSLGKIKIMHELGQVHFGENKVQELVEKYENLPSSIYWHQVGHLQTNKVKYIAPFIHLIHSVDSLKLLREINKQGKKNNRKINCLLQVYIGSEESKFGMNEITLTNILQNEISDLPFVEIKGIMAMATNTDNIEILKKEFNQIHTIYNSHKKNYNFEVLSMGMSSDYQLAIECGSNMVRIGTSLFGERN